MLNGAAGREREADRRSLAIAGNTGENRVASPSAAMERRVLKPRTSSLQSCEHPLQEAAATGVYDARPRTTSYTPSGLTPDAASGPNNPDLAALIAAWPKPREPVRAGINAMVQAAPGSPKAR